MQHPAIHRSDQIALDQGQSDRKSGCEARVRRVEVPRHGQIVDQVRAEFDHLAPPAGFARHGGHEVFGVAESLGIPGGGFGGLFANHQQVSQGMCGLNQLRTVIEHFRILLDERLVQVNQLSQRGELLGNLLPFVEQVGEIRQGEAAGVGILIVGGKLAHQTAPAGDRRAVLDQCLVGLPLFRQLNPAIEVSGRGAMPLLRIGGEVFPQFLQDVGGTASQLGGLGRLVEQVAQAGLVQLKIGQCPSLGRVIGMPFDIPLLQRQRLGVLIARLGDALLEAERFGDSSQGESPQDIGPGGRGLLAGELIEFRHRLAVFRQPALGIRRSGQSPTDGQMGLDPRQSPGKPRWFLVQFRMFQGPCTKLDDTVLQP